MANNKYIKRYKCPYCEKRLERNNLDNHIEKYHQDMIPSGYTASRVAFNYINKKEVGHCIICGNETDWNEDKKRYERLCNNPKCKKEYIKLCEDRLKKARGKTKSEMLSDPEFQGKMLKGRKISGKYTFENGEKMDYVGSYEKNFLEFMDKFLHVNPIDIQSPGPTIEYLYEGKKHFWITDFYYIPYNLVIDVKDGGNNPNNRNMAVYRAKQVAKEKAISELGQYNYIRLTDNQFDQLFQIMFELKDSMVDLEVLYNKDTAKMKPIIKINEVFTMDSIERSLQITLMDPMTYKTKDLSKIDSYIEGVTDPYVMLDLETWLRTSMSEGYLRYIEYHRYITGGKCSYDFQAQCESFKANDITLNQIFEIKELLKELYIKVHEKAVNTKTDYSGEVRNVVGVCEPMHSENYYTEADVEYYLKYIV